jgi:thiol-disulfide isomerase/thioredoxin
MRFPLSVASLPLVAALICPLLPAQAALPLPGCEASPEVRKIIDEKLDYSALLKLKVAERWTLERKTLDDLIAKYPRELQPYESLSNGTREYAPDEYEAFRDQWVKMAKDHPDDPLALLLAGEAQNGRDTPEAIRLLEAAKAKAPDFPWPSLQLADIYFSGERADKDKLAANLEAFFAVCPASRNGRAQWLLNKDQPLQPKVAVSMRASLEKETDPKRLEDFETLWGLEFRTRPPSEHEAVRARVAEDLKRLETLNPKGDAEWQAFLITGYKESGASKETIAAKEDALMRDFPHSSEAYDIAYNRWDKAHTKPDDETDKAAWAKYQKEYEEALKGWISQYTDVAYLQRYEWFYAVYNDDSIPEKEALAALDTYLQSVRDYEAASNSFWDYERAADFLVDRRRQPKRAMDLLKQAKAALDKDRERSRANDNRSDEQIKESREEDVFEDQMVNGFFLRAAMQAGEPEEAMKLKASIESPPPDDKKFQSGYWLNRARLEALERHTQDALAYYQLALQARTEPPKAYRGKVEDPLTDEARALWKVQGGSDAAWAVWSKPPAGAATQLAEGAWEKATKPIPQFELSDMSGKTWKLKELGGKTLLINLWATWCGPCQAELPHLQKFYEKVKDRKDIQVLTFDIDEDLGLVEPYLKEKGYTFPVLPAYSTVVSLLDGFAIPQNWLVDAHGNWQLKQIGYGGGSEADFEKDMLAHLDAAKSSQ